MSPSASSGRNESSRAESKYPSLRPLNAGADVAARRPYPIWPTLLIAPGGAAVSEPDEASPNNEVSQLFGRGSAEKLIVHVAATSGIIPLLHVDDSAKERLLVSQAILLSKVPFAFHEADCLESAVAHFQLRDGKGNTRPRLVLLDYDLGDHTGCDFLCWLRQAKKMNSLPVVMFSGSVGEPYVEQCYATGANFFLRKAKTLSRLKVIVHVLHESIFVLQRPAQICLLPEYIPDARKRVHSRQTQ